MVVEIVSCTISPRFDNFTQLYQHRMTKMITTTTTKTLILISTILSFGTIVTKTTKTTPTLMTAPMALHAVMLNVPVDTMHPIGLTS